MGRAEDWGVVVGSVAAVALVGGEEEAAHELIFFFSYPTPSRLMNWLIDAPAGLE